MWVDTSGCHLCSGLHLEPANQLLIRSTARLIIRLQGSEDCKEGSDELTKSRQNHLLERFAPPLAPVGTPAYGNGGISLPEHALYSDEDGPLDRPEQNDLSESRISFGSRRKLLAATGVVAALGVCVCASFLLASSNQTVPQTAELSASVQVVPASTVQTGPNESELFAAAARSESLSSRTPVRLTEPLDASQKVPWAPLPTMPASLTSASATRS